MVFLPNKNVIFVAGLGGIGLDTSREIVKAGPKVSEVSLNGKQCLKKDQKTVLSDPNQSLLDLITRFVH